MTFYDLSLLQSGINHKESSLSLKEKFWTPLLHNLKRDGEIEDRLGGIFLGWK